MVSDLFESAAENGSKNRLEPAEAKLATLDYLEMQEEELERFPHLRGEPHWFLTAADGHRDADAMYLIVLFDGDAVHMQVGLGDFADVRRFAENDFPEDPNEVLRAAANRFRVLPTRSVHRGLFDEWLYAD